MVRRGKFIRSNTLLMTVIEQSSLCYPPWVGTSHQEHQIQPVCAHCAVGDDEEEYEAGDDGDYLDLLLRSVTSKHREDTLSVSRAVALSPTD